MVYGHADHNLCISLIYDMLEMAESGESNDFNIIVLADFHQSDNKPCAGIENFDYYIPDDGLYLEFLKS